MPGSDREESQRRVCVVHRCDFVPAHAADIAGIALSTIGMEPINGLRHPALPGTTGWYVWCGESLSTAPDFFQPLCIEHLVERLPLVANLLGLPPGYRFLIADGHEDIWFDANLLNV